ncbi:hypothetical protein 2 [Ginkgo biloba narna-like virus]|nr:hypothetical protein 2 [Ginkgo biloba narna-like virus]QKI28958.1 hypothetical protein 2 [Lactuca sativa narna-like virus]
MVKKLMLRKKNVAKKVNKAPKTSIVRQYLPNEKLDLYGKYHAVMLSDPCGADLHPTVYSGDRGYINRFTSNTVVGVGASETTFAYLVKPGNQCIHASAAAASFSSTTLAYAVGSFPGNTFLNTNSSKARAAGFCVTVRPIAAPSVATGTLHFGIVNAASLANGVSLTFDQIIQMCTESVSVSQALMAPLEVKWSPGGFDDRYNSYGIITDDDSDRNVLVIVGTGLNAALGCQMKLTAITEWCPRGTVGIVNDSTQVKPSVCDKDCVLRALKAKDHKWWWSLGTKAWKVGKNVAQGYYSGGAIGALSAGVSSFI